jgi:hypothetical protein
LPERILKRFHTYSSLLLLLLFSATAGAQYKVKGTVFDSLQKYTIESVSVLTTAGRGTVTDSMGRYQIEVGEKDSIWFSFLGKATRKYAVLSIADITQFNISLKYRSDVMPEVRVRSRIYKEDSIQFRKDYAKGFNFRRPNLGTMTSVTTSGVGFDINEIIRLFQFRKNRNMEKFRERLLEQEREKYIDHKFTKGLVRRLTGLEGDALETFMKEYRPSYELALLASDYDFRYYIQQAGIKFKSQRTF